MGNFTTLDLLVFIACIVRVAWFGAWMGRKQTSTRDYFLGGRQIPWWVIGLSVMATQYVKRNASEAHYLKASRWATVLWVPKQLRATGFFAG